MPFTDLHEHIQGVFHAFSRVDEYDVQLTLWCRRRAETLNELSRDYYWRNRSVRLPKIRAWQKANPERQYGYVKAWRERNPEKARAILNASTKRWRKRNPDKARAAKQRQRARNPEHWREVNRRNQAARRARLKEQQRRESSRKEAA